MSSTPESKYTNTKVLAHIECLLAILYLIEGEMQCGCEVVYVEEHKEVIRLIAYWRIRLYGEVTGDKEEQFYKNQCEDKSNMEKADINISTLKHLLSAYGKVEICNEFESTFHVKITDGFKTNARNTFKCMELILKYVGEKYPNIKRNIFDEDFYELILKP